MARIKRQKKTYTYQCTITNESYKTTREVENPDELISVKAFYDMCPEDDDRPEVIKKKLASEE